MNRMLMAVALLAIAGCAQRPDPAPAERRFQLVMQHGSDQEQCDAAREVRDIYLHREEELSYRQWEATSVVQCMDVPLNLQHVD